jgi:hypothetical protein
MQRDHTSNINASNILSTKRERKPKAALRYDAPAPAAHAVAKCLTTSKTTKARLARQRDAIAAEPFERLAHIGFDVRQEGAAVARVRVALFCGRQAAPNLMHSDHHPLPTTPHRPARA